MELSHPQPEYSYATNHQCSSPLRTGKSFIVLHSDTILRSSHMRVSETGDAIATNRYQHPPRHRSKDKLTSQADVSNLGTTPAPCQTLQRRQASHNSKECVRYTYYCNVMPCHVQTDDTLMCVGVADRCSYVHMHCPGMLLHNRRSHYRLRTAYCVLHTAYCVCQAGSIRCGVHTASCPIRC